MHSEHHSIHVATPWQSALNFALAAPHNFYEMAFNLITYKICLKIILRTVKCDLKTQEQV